MVENPVFTLTNHQNGHLAFKLFWFEDNRHFDHLQRNNFYSLIWVTSGSGLLRADFAEHVFSENTVFAFAPYQPFMFSVGTDFSGVAVQFHTDFYCIHRNPKETNCDTTLFNNVYQPPFFKMGEDLQTSYSQILDNMKTELQNAPTGNYELLVPLLKILLVAASRQKQVLQTPENQLVDSSAPFLLRKLKTVIEENFRQKHSPSDYAELLHITPNALSKLAKTHFQKTPTELIHERIIIEAKRELYMTSKPVKEIAWHLGYSDEFYFSRVFKNYAEVSPMVYRETVGFGRAEGVAG
ncbi:MAG: helix-turn-helix transcriptional regulator [Saprospiraceae bacterium]|nr:helix-turn-helix transcriptional regulator [Saprospiraceae bacterium]